MKKLLFIIVGITLLLSSCKEGGLSRDAFVLDVQTVALDANNSIWFGGKQKNMVGCHDIIIDAMQDSALEIRRTDSGFVWHLHKPAYVKFDGVNNPNAVDYDSISTISVAGVTLSKEQIDNKLDEQNRLKKLDGKNWRYTSLSDIIKIVENRRNPQIDSVRSLIAMTKKDKKLILLDEGITVTKINRTTIDFTNTGTINNNTVKIEFFRTLHSSFLSPKDKENYLHWSDTCFSASVKSFYTPFGADEITVQATDSNTLVSFNKIFRAVIPKKTIDKVFADNDEIPISVRQLIHANTYSNEVYTMDMSNSAYLELGTINPKEDYKFTPSEQNTFLKDGKFESYNIADGTFWKGCLSLVLVFLLGMLVIIFVTRYEYISDNNNPDNDRFRWYFAVLYCILFLLCIGRIFIGYNLSFTQPFVSYAFPTAVIVSPLLMLGVLMFWVVFWGMDFGFENILLLKDRKKWYYRLLYVPIVALFLVAIWIISECCLSDIFAFYWNDFDWFSFIWWVSVKNVSVNVLTIKLLIIAACVLSVLLLVRKEISYKKQRCKEWLPANFTQWGIIFILIISISFLFMGTASYSAGLLSIALLLFWFLGKFIETQLEKSFKHRIVKWLLSLIPITFVAAVAFGKSDSGYIINLPLFPIIMVIALAFLYHFYGVKIAKSIGRRERIKNTIKSLLIIFLLAGGIVIYAFVISKNYDPFSSDRLTERSVAYFEFSTIQEKGVRISEERGQFFAILAKYAYPSEYDCYEPIHSGISNYIDPVVENDLSVPFGLIFQFGAKYWWLSWLILGGLWLALCFFVLKMSIIPQKETANSDKDPKIYFSKYGMIRIFCMSVLVSSGVWLILSYYGVVPFTGRLIFGLGQDSIAEVFETLFLFAFMGLIGKTQNN
ncbi:MAG: hypothetical protein LBS01_00875 [Prevotellaceae bacterium]|jgi:hypothetical protein|nr:hypothetical protein [Prevotellaceae bacterium]